MNRNNLNSLANANLNSNANLNTNSNFNSIFNSSSNANLNSNFNSCFNSSPNCMYENYDSTSSCSGFNQLSYANPLATADVSGNFSAAAQGRNFVGQGLELNSTNCSKAYYFLVNPNNSNTNIVVNKVVTSNLSCSNIKCDYSLGNIPSNLCNFNKSCFITNSNTANLNSRSKGIIYSGNAKNYKPFNFVYTTTTEANKTLNEDFNSSIILAPGTCLLMQISPIADNFQSRAITSFSWWEYPCNVNCSCTSYCDCDCDYTCKPDTDC